MNISGTMIGSLGVAALAVMMAVYHRGYDRGMSDAPERVRQDRIETERWADELAVDAAWQS